MSIASEPQHLCHGPSFRSHQEGCVGIGQSTSDESICNKTERSTIRRISCRITQVLTVKLDSFVPPLSFMQTNLFCRRWRILWEMSFVVGKDTFKAGNVALFIYNIVLQKFSLFTKDSWPHICRCVLHGVLEQFFRRTKLRKCATTLLMNGGLQFGELSFMLALALLKALRFRRTLALFFHKLGMLKAYLTKRNVRLCMVLAQYSGSILPLS